MIYQKNSDEIEKMRRGGQIAAHVLNLLAITVKPGITTGDLDILARAELKKARAKASFFHYQGYPASICTSVNSEVVHGIPGGRILREGDIIGIDLGVQYEGFHTDTALTLGVGKINFQKKELIDIAKKSLDEGLSIIKPGLHLGDIQHRIQTIVEGAGFSVIRDLSGHGIGQELQEYPPILNYGKAGTGLILKEGYTLAIEPMISDGDWHVKILKDDWTVVTADGSLSAHFEHTVVVTKSGYDILTTE
ncbi:MAG: type I methionyl aminopeptidase [Patescibacteria group bacterium]|jgi:methionyl aminopeptidase